MIHRPSKTANSDVREIILEAAGRIFAQNGFRATTVRKITREAGVNVAAINYYFRDKQELYVRVLQRAHQAAARTAAADHAGTAQEKLRAFIHGFLSYLFDPQRPEWQGRLMAREIAEPSPALDRFVAESILPVKERLFGILQELIGPQVSDEQKRRIGFSILGQCLYYVHCREMINRLFPVESRNGQDVNALAEHIFHFTMGGIAGLQRKTKSPTAKHRSSAKASAKAAS